MNNKDDLKLFIEQLKNQSAQLEQDDYYEKPEKLSQISTQLTHNSNSNGMFTNPLTSDKYYPTTIGLKGGGIPYASECIMHNPDNLYTQFQNILENELNYLVHYRRSTGKKFITNLLATPTLFFNFPTTVGITLYNFTKYSLEYVSCGSKEGYFFTGNGTARESFKGPNETIEPGYLAGFVHMKKNNSVFGSVGYISFRIRSDGDNYIVSFGWSVHRVKANRAGLEIRSSRGSAVEPSGVVADYDKFLNLEHHGGDDAHLVNSEAIGKFRLKYYFHNSKSNALGFQLFVEQI